MKFKSEFHLKERQFSVANPIWEKVLSKLPTPSKKGKPLWEKEQ